MIFSTSVFGDNPRYSFGAQRQYELAKHFYPDFEFRLYTDDASKFNMPDAKVIEVKDGSYGVFWRFFPLFESDNEIVIVRDADSRVTEREAQATYLWMESPKRFHIMRDHDAHFQDKPIIASTFGIKGKLSNAQWNAMQSYLHGEHRYGSDEEFLRDHMWDESQSLINEYNKGWFGISRQLLLNKYQFCGNGWDETDMPIYPPSMAEFHGYNRNELPLSAKFAGYPK